MSTVKSHIKSFGKGLIFGINELLDIDINYRYPVEDGKSMIETDSMEAINNDMRRVYGDIHKGVVKFKKEAHAE
jgi:hypothetical protein